MPPREQHLTQAILRPVRCLFLVLLLALGHAGLAGSEGGFGIPSCEDYNTAGCADGYTCLQMTGSVCRTMNEVDVPPHCKLESFGCTMNGPYHCSWAWVECNWVEDVH